MAVGRSSSPETPSPDDRDGEDVMRIRRSGELDARPGENIAVRMIVIE